MAITAWKEAASAATLVAGKRGVHEWTAPYILTSDNPRDDALTCVEFMGSINRGIYSVFRYGDTVDSSVCCNSIAPVRMQGSVEYWLVTLSYGPPVPIKDEPDPVDHDGNPTDDPDFFRYSISVANASFQVPVDQAWNIDAFPAVDPIGSGGYVRFINTLGPVHNSAGIVYDPPLMRDITELVVRITGNKVEWEASFAMLLCNTINNTNIKWHKTLTTKYGFKECAFTKHCVLCSGHSAVRRDGYWEQTWEFRLRTPATNINPQDGFLETVLDQGYTRLAGIGDPDGRGGTYTSGDLEVGAGIGAAVRDMDGERTPERVLLNGHGQPIQSSSTLLQPPVYFRWRVQPEEFFPGLPLDIFESA